MRITNLLQLVLICCLALGFAACEPAEPNDIPSDGSAEDDDDDKAKKDKDKDKKRSKKDETTDESDDDEADDEEDEEDDKPISRPKGTLTNDDYNPDAAGDRLPSRRFAAEIEAIEPKIDLLIIRENTSSTNQVRNLLWPSNPSSPGNFGNLAESLAARISASRADFRVAVLDGALNDETNSGLLESIEDVSYFVGGTESFRADLITRLSTQNFSSQTFYKPLTRLRDFLTLTADPTTTNSQFRRDDAIFAVLFYGVTDETNETVVPVDLVPSLASAGTSFSVSAIVPDETGCEYPNGSRTNPEDQERVNAVLGLQRLGGGAFTSICAPSFSQTVDDMFAKAMNSDEITVTLEEDPIPQSIQVYLGTNLTYEWEYSPAARRLRIKRYLPIAFDVQVYYEPAGSQPPRFSSAVPDDGVPDLQERQISPEEQEFVDTINPILRSWCGGCHRNGNLTRYVDNFRLTTLNKSLIKDRIELEIDATGVMPPNNAESFQMNDQYTTLIEWLSE